MGARAHDRGDRGERAVRRRLARRGWRVVARNWRGGGAEIDLVALRDGVLAFVEVKTRGSDDGTGERVTARQRERIECAASAFLARAGAPGPETVRFDLALVTARRPPLPPRIDYVEGAWTPDSGPVA